MVRPAFHPAFPPGRCDPALSGHVGVGPPAQSMRTPPIVVVVAGLILEMLSRHGVLMILWTDILDGTTTCTSWLVVDVSGAICRSDVFQDLRGRGEVSLRAACPMAFRRYAMLNSWRRSFAGRRPRPQFRKVFQRVLQNARQPKTMRRARPRVKTVTEEFPFNKDVTGNGGASVTYITLPPLGVGARARERGSISLCSVNINGSFRLGTIPPPVVPAAPGEPPREPKPASMVILGVVAFFLVLDRSPSTGGLPSFSDVFATSTNFMADAMVREDRFNRFKVLLRHKEVVDVAAPLHITSFSPYVSLGGRRSICASFRDSDGVTTGSYGNTSRNALLMYVTWDSSIPSLLEFGFNTRLSFV